MRASRCLKLTVEKTRHSGSLERIREALAGHRTALRQVRVYGRDRAAEQRGA